MTSAIKIFACAITLWLTVLATGTASNYRDSVELQKWWRDQHEQMFVDVFPRGRYSADRTLEGSVGRHPK